jgi:hypothetical protein
VLKQFEAPNDPKDRCRIPLQPLNRSTQPTNRNPQSHERFRSVNISHWLATLSRPPNHYSGFAGIDSPRRAKTEIFQNEAGDEGAAPKDD